MVAAGSDDPITFATDLPSEYQLLEDALLMSGESARSAAAWINEVRQTGLETSFLSTSWWKQHPAEIIHATFRDTVQPPP